MPYPMTPATRVRPTLTSADLNRRPNGSRIDGSGAPVPTGGPVDDTFNVMPTAPRPVITAATRAPMPVAPVAAAAPNLAGLSGFGLENAKANAGLYAPGSFGASNAVANGTGRPYQPPQQTERANPLSGDNNYPVEGRTTAVARAPFVQRGAGIPGGSDALPAPIKTTDTEDDTIAGSMAGTQSRLRGTPSPFARRFGQPAQQSIYDGYLKRLNQPAPASAP